MGLTWGEVGHQRTCRGTGGSVVPTRRAARAEPSEARHDKPITFILLDEMDDVGRRDGRRMFCDSFSGKHQGY